MIREAVFAFAATLLCAAGASASAAVNVNEKFPPPADPLAFVQGKWKQARTGEGVLEVVGNKIIVAEPADFDFFGKHEKGAVVFVIKDFRIDPSDTVERGFRMRVSGIKYSGFGGKVSESEERYMQFGAFPVDGKYRYRFIGGDRDLPAPAP